MIFLILLISVSLTSGLSENQKCLKTISNTKLLCFYSDLINLETLKLNCKCTHVIVPSTLDSKIIKNLKESNDGVKIFVTINELNQETISLIKSSNPHGLNLNLNLFKKISSHNDIIDVITTLRAKLNEKLEIIVSVPKKIDVLARFYDFKRLKKLGVEAFLIQSDFLAPKKAVTFHPSRLSGIFDDLNTDSLVDLVTNLGLPESKVIISIPVQGYHFTLKNENETSLGSPAIEVRSINRDEICEKFGEFSDWKEGRDQDLTGLYIYRKNDWISFEDPISIDIKAKYARIRGLYGLALKDLSQDLSSCQHKGQNQNQTSILDATYRSLSKQPRAPRGAILQSLKREILYKENDLNLEVNQNDQVNLNQNQDLPCPHQGYFVHPEDCNRFYRCVQFYQPTKSNPTSKNSFTIFQFSCPSGLTFDERYEVCTWPLNVENGTRCHGSSEIAPKKQFNCPSEIGFYADLTDCRWFYACLDHGLDDHLTAYEFRCPFGLVFDEEKLMCEWPWLVSRCSFETRVNIDIYGGKSKEFVGVYGELNGYDGLGALKRVNLIGFDDQSENLNLNGRIDLAGNSNLGQFGKNENGYAQNYDSNVKIDGFGANLGQKFDQNGRIDLAGNLNSNLGQFEINFDKNANGNAQNYDSNIKSDAFGVNFGQKIDQNERINLAGNSNSNLGHFEINFDNNANGNAQNYDSNIKSDAFGVNFGQKFDQNGRINMAGNLNSNLGQFEINFDKNANGNAQNYDSNIKSDAFGVNFGQKFDQNGRINMAGNLNSNLGQFEINFDKNANGNTQNYDSNIKSDAFGVNFGQKLDQNGRINMAGNLNSNLGQFEINFDKNVNGKAQNYDSSVKSEGFGVYIGQKLDQNKRINLAGNLNSNLGLFESNFDKNVNGNVQNYDSNVKNEGFGVNLGQNLDQNERINLAGNLNSNLGLFESNFDKNVNGNTQNYDSNVKSEGFGVNLGQNIDQNGKIDLAGNLNSNLGQFEANSDGFKINFDKNVNGNTQNYVSNVKSDAFGVNFGQKLDQNGKIDLAGNLNSNLGQFEVNSDGFEVNFDKNVNGYAQSVDANIKIDQFGAKLGQKLDQNDRINLAGNLNSNIGQVEVNTDSFEVNFDKNANGNAQNIDSNIKSDAFGVNLGEKLDQNLAGNLNSNIGQFEVNSGAIGINFDKNVNGNVQNYDSNLKTDGFEVNFGQKLDQNERINLNSNLGQLEINSNENSKNFKNNFGQKLSQNVNLNEYQSNSDQNLNQNDRINFNIAKLDENSNKNFIDIRYGKNLELNGFGTDSGQKSESFGFINGGFSNRFDARKTVDIIGGGFSAVKTFKNRPILTNLEDISIQSIPQSIPTVKTVHLPEKVDLNQGGVIANIPQLQINVDSPQNQGYFYDKPKIKFEDGVKNVNFDRFYSELDKNKADYEKMRGTLQKIELNHDFGQKLTHFDHSNLNSGQNGAKLVQINANVDHGQDFDQTKVNVEDGNESNLNLGQNRPQIVQVYSNVHHGERFDRVKSNLENQNIKIDENLGQKVVHVEGYNRNQPKFYANVDHSDQIESNFDRSNLNSGQNVVNVEEYGRNRPEFVRVHTNLDHSDRIQSNFIKIDHNINSGLVNDQNRLKTIEIQSNLGQGQFLDHVRSDFEQNSNQNFKIDHSTSHSNLNLGQGAIKVEGYSQNRPQFESNHDHFDQNHSNFGQDVNIDQSNLNSGQSVVNVGEYDQNRPEFVRIHTNVDHSDQIQSNFGGHNIKIDQSNLNSGQSVVNVGEYDQNRPEFVRILTNVDHSDQSQSNFGGHNIKIDQSNLNSGQSAVNVEKYDQNQPEFKRINTNVDHSDRVQSNFGGDNVKIDHNLNSGQVNDQNQLKSVEIESNLGQGQFLNHFEQNSNQNIKIDHTASHSNLNIGQDAIHVEDYKQNRPQFVRIESNLDRGQHFNQAQSNFDHSNLNSGQSVVNVEVNRPKSVEIESNLDQGQFLGHVKTDFEQNSDQNIKIDHSTSHSNLNLGQGVIHVEDYKQNRPQFVRIESNLDHEQHYDLNKSNFESQNVNIDHANLNSGQTVVNVEVNRPKTVEVESNLGQNQFSDQILNQNYKIDHSASHSNLNLGQGAIKVDEYTQNQPQFVRIESNLDHGQHFDQDQSKIEGQNVNIDHSNLNSGRIDHSTSHYNLNLGQGAINVEDYKQNRPQFVRIESNIDRGQHFDQGQWNFESQKIKIDHSNLNSGETIEVNRPKTAEIESNLGQGQLLNHFEQDSNQKFKINHSTSHSNLNLGKGAIHVEDYNQNRSQFVQIESNLGREQHFDRSNLNLGQTVVHIEDYNQNRPKFVQVQSNFGQDQRFDQIESNVEDQNVKIAHSNLNLGQTLVNIEEYNQNRPKFVQIQSNLGQDQRFDQIQSNVDDQNIKIEDSNLNLGQNVVNNVEGYSTEHYLGQSQSNLNQDYKIEHSTAHSNLNLGQGVVNVDGYDQNQKIQSNLGQTQQFDQIQNVKIDQPDLNLSQIISNVEEYDQNQQNLQHYDRIQSIFDHNSNQNVKIKSSKLDFGQIASNVDEYLGYEKDFGQKLNQNVKIDSNSDQNGNVEPVSEVPFVKKTAYQTGDVRSFDRDEKLSQNIKIDGFEASFADKLNKNGKIDGNSGQIDQSQKVFGQNRVVITQKPLIYHQIDPVLVENPAILISSTPNPKIFYFDSSQNGDVKKILNKKVKIESNYDASKSRLNQIRLNLDDFDGVEPNPIKTKDYPDKVDLNEDVKIVVKTTSKPEVNQFLVETSQNKGRGNKKVIEFYEIDQDKLKTEDKIIEVDDNKKQNQGNRRKVIRINKTSSTLNDFNPVLTLKLGAQCTCVSNPIIIKSKTKKNDRNNLESDQFEVNKINLNRGNPRKRPNLNQNDTVVVKHENNNKKVVQEIHQKLIDDQKLVDDQKLTQKLTQKPFNRYGPGGLRSNEETLQGIDCKRPGLFRHPSECSKFCSCVFDAKKKRFKLYIFDCPVHLTFDNTLSACNWPGKGPACVKNTLITVD